MKKLLSLLLAATMLLSLSFAIAEESKAPDPKSILEGVELEPSKDLYFEEPLEITGMGIHFNNYPTEYDGCYYFLP